MSLRVPFLAGLALVVLSPSLPAQQTPATSVPAIVDEIGKLENVRDPKCYATAARLEDFIYGTTLQTETRFEKIGLQKKLIRGLWERASDAATAAGKSQVDAATLGPVIQATVPYIQLPNGGDWVVHPDDAHKTIVTSRDKRQYGNVAYALRAILAVQQDVLLDSSVRLAPLAPDAVALMKEAIDLATLAALQDADRESRRLGREFVGPDLLKKGWNAIVPAEPPTAAAKATKTPAMPAAAPASLEKFFTIKSIIGEKLTAYAVYNDIAMPVFLRNVQVYFARHLWPTDPEEGKIFKDQFTEAMVAWTRDMMLAAEKNAKKAGHPFLRVEDVNVALQLFEPHELNEFEDCIYFPRLPHNEQVYIEAYDLDAFRDPGVHWMYLSEVINDPKYPGKLEPDPFAAELITEGAAQFGVLVLRVAGTIASQEGTQRLDHKQLAAALKVVQEKLDKNASLPPPKKPVSRIVSSTVAGTPAKGKYFTDVTAEAGIQFEHRLSDWLARMIRSYTIVEDNKAQLAIAPAFGGSGIAAEDVDNDGNVDVLLLGGGGIKLYLNEGNGHFRDATAESGLVWKRPDGTFGEPRQPIIADFDNDGLQDILITYVDDDHRLFRNLGHGHFQDVTESCGLGGKGLVGGPATAIDFDGDGLLDLYIGYFGDYIHGTLPTLSRYNDNALPNKLFRNKGNFKFEDVTEGSGVDNRGWTQAVGHADIDGDGREDLICGNDFGVNAYYRNLGNGKFENVAHQLGLDKASFTMNIGITDLNRDGFPDFYISNIVTMNKDEKYVLPDTKMRMKFDPKKLATMRVVEANDLFTSNAVNGKLESYTHSDAVGRGMSSTGWSWGANFFDFDNDGDDDLYLVNGMNEYAVYSSINPYLSDSSGQSRNVIMPVADKERAVFFVNTNGRLEEQSAASGADALGNARGVAYFDYDNDGDLDMIVNNFDGPAVLYRNNSEKNGNHWLKIRLEGNPAKGVTRDAIGARIIVDTAHNKGLWREVFSTVGYLTSNPKEQHFGLGKDTSADVTVIWPGGERQHFAGLAVDRAWHIAQGGSPVPVPSPQKKNAAEKK
ncbi:MAG TPA: CRTAC1 family protein [Thermoanaerobaculia bacterium]|nr:CRTAC1 family protein [Thermoanaerobaculia bacterium]